jgi:hypothetical protein
VRIARTPHARRDPGNVGTGGTGGNVSYADADIREREGIEDIENVDMDGDEWGDPDAVGLDVRLLPHKSFTTLPYPCSAADAGTYLGSRRPTVTAPAAASAQTQSPAAAAPAQAQARTLAQAAPTPASTKAQTLTPARALAQAPALAPGGGSGEPQQHRSNSTERVGDKGTANAKAAGAVEANGVGAAEAVEALEAEETDIVRGSFVPEVQNGFYAQQISALLKM